LPRWLILRRAIANGKDMTQMLAQSEAAMQNKKGAVWGKGIALGEPECNSLPVAAPDQLLAVCHRAASGSVLSRRGVRQAAVAMRCMRTMMVQINHRPDLGQ
jgi:hypothetical protein